MSSINIVIRGDRFRIFNRENQFEIAEQNDDISAPVTRSALRARDLDTLKKMERIILENLNYQVGPEEAGDPYNVSKERIITMLINESTRIVNACRKALKESSIPDLQLKEQNVIAQSFALDKALNERSKRCE